MSLPTRDYDYNRLVELGVQAQLNIKWQCVATGSTRPVPPPELPSTYAGRPLRRLDFSNK